MKKEILNYKTMVGFIASLLTKTNKWQCKKKKNEESVTTDKSNSH